MQIWHRHLFEKKKEKKAAIKGENPNQQKLNLLLPADVKMILFNTNNPNVRPAAASKTT